MALLRLPPALRLQLSEHFLRTYGGASEPSLRVVRRPFHSSKRSFADMISSDGPNHAQSGRNQVSASGKHAPTPSESHTPASTSVNTNDRQQGEKLNGVRKNAFQLSKKDFAQHLAVIREFAQGRKTKRERAEINRRLDRYMKDPNRASKIKSFAESLVKPTKLAASKIPELLDIKHIRKTMNPPTQADYPDAPVDFFDHKRINSAFNNACQALKVSLEASLDYDTKQINKSACVHVCDLKVQIPDVCDESATGEGWTKQDAKYAAWLHLLAKMHASGSLKELLTRPDEMAVATEIISKLPSTTPVLDQQTLHQQKDAKAEIFNYLASFGMVPEFSYQKVMLRKSSRRLLMSHGSQGSQPSIKVTIKLPDYDIEVSGTSKDVKTAEVHAALAFKSAAENKMSTGEDDSSRPDPSFAVLTTNTAEYFFDFYKEAMSRMRLEIEQDAVNGLPVQLRSARLTVDDEPVGPMIIMPNKKEAVKLAYLAGAVTICKSEPHLLQEFVQRLKKDKGKILRPLSAPIDLDVPLSVQEEMRQALIDARSGGLPDRKSALSAITKANNSRLHRRRILQPPELHAKSQILKDKLHEFEQNPDLEQLRTTKASLPMNDYGSKVVEMITQNQYSIVVGATGSGKTTQVPQMLLDAAIRQGVGAECNVICTQPRRIAATSVAHRVAAERNEQAGESVGYSVRFDSKLPQPGGSITYCTTGILLERLKHDPDGVFGTTSHFCLDEVHERDLNIDFLMIVLKKAMATRKAMGKNVPKVVLMSATLDTELFASYFAQLGNDDAIQPCPSITVPGRTFPVKEKYLDEIMQEMSTHGSRVKNFLSLSAGPSTDYLTEETNFSGDNASDTSTAEMVIDWKRERQPAEADEWTMPSAVDERKDAIVPCDLIALTIAHICKTTNDGAILAFVPGLEEITTVQRSLEGANLLGEDFNDGSKFKILPLHSTIPPQEQAEVFTATPPGCRKIILSTNIAETSVTVPDVKFVVDSGKLREKRYDQVRRITKLATTWVSKSNSRQRAGRAGRVQSGSYYALFSKERRDSLRAVGLPELLRSDLQETCLSIKARGFQGSVEDFLGQAIEPPLPEAVSAAVENLVAIEAFTDDEELTDLGEILSRLPIHPTLGKMIILGIVFRALDPILTLGAAGSGRLFVTPMGTEARAAAGRTRRGYAENDQSDHMAMLRAFRDIRQLRDQNGMFSAMQRARELYIHNGNFKGVDNDAKQIVQILTQTGLIPPSRPGDRRTQYGPAELNTNSDNIPLVKALLISGLHPNLGVRRSHGGKSNRTASEETVLIHSHSVNNDAKRDTSRLPYGTLFAYRALDVSPDNQIWARDTTIVTPIMAILFGGKVNMHNYNRLTMDEWLPFFVKAGDRQYAAKLLLEFRKCLDRILNSVFNSLANRNAGHQWAGIAEDRVVERFATSVVRVLDEDDAFCKATAAGFDVPARRY
nr:atp-dependent rna helicase dhx36 [Quercus suber]